MTLMRARGGRARVLAPDHDAAGSLGLASQDGRVGPGTVGCTRGFSTFTGTGMAAQRSSQRSPATRRRDYFGVLRTALVCCALLLALLPIPVTALRLLPVYETHARFLLFYAPVVCLLLLAYLFYIRDGLARLMFADILRPMPEHDPYYRTSSAELGKRWLRRFRASLLALLPALLLASSFYCMIRYTTRLAESLEVSATAVTAGVVAEEVKLDGTDSTRVAQPSGSDSRRLPSRESPKSAPVADSVSDDSVLQDPDSLMRAASIDSIPLFAELTALYIGIFASALTAVIMMALKEYAKEAMGLTERELMLGDWGAAGGDDSPTLPPPHQ